MGATVLVSSERLLAASPIELLTNEKGRFSAAILNPGMYSVKVTLAGFLPSIEEHVQVNGRQTTLVEIVLGSVFASLEKMRHEPDVQIPSDEWIWVLRASSSNRPVLRWQDGNDGTVTLAGGISSSESPQKSEIRGQLDLTSGSDHPGSVSNLADSPATAFAYDWKVGANGKLLMAGQFSYDGTTPSGGFATEWLPSGEQGVGPVTSILVRESRVGPDGPMFRGIRMSHDDQLAIGDRVTIRYGGELVVAGLGNTTESLRPRAEVALKLSPAWFASISAASQPWDDTSGTSTGLQSALDTLDALPTLLLRDGRPVLESGMHEELAIERILSKNSSVTASVFHDHSSHTAIFGLGPVSGPDYLQDSFSNVFAYDAGASSSTGARVAYHQKLSRNLDAELVYAYAGALAPSSNAQLGVLRDELATQYRHSAAGRFTATIPRSHTKLTASYKWISGAAVSHQDAYGESMYQLDPYLNVAIRQPLPGFIPGHAEAIVDVGNLLKQGYVPVATSDGSIVLVPSYRYLRGGFSFQF
ncbi:MAG: carboxypeptidase-like regulatory domain-containing protein [Blastocatellia bacterium]